MYNRTYTPKFIETLNNDTLFIKTINDIKFIGELPSYAVFFDDDLVSLEKEEFIASLEYYESYTEIPFYYLNTKYSVVIYYGMD